MCVGGGGDGRCVCVGGGAQVVRHIQLVSINYQFSSRGLCNIVGVSTFQYRIDKGQSFAWNKEPQ